MAIVAEAGGGDHVLELTPCVVEALASDSEDARSVASSEDAAPLLIQPENKPRFNIFSAPYSRRQPRELVVRYDETDTSPLTQFMLWVWSGSRYSGLLCMAFSSVIYFLMEVVSSVFTAQSIPLLETAFTRYTCFLIFSYWWLRKSGHPVLGPAQARNLLALRAITGFLSLLSFVYCIQMLPLSQAIVLSSTTPIIASIMARIILQEKLKIQEIGGLACSFFGVLFIFQQTFTTQAVNTNRRSHQVFAVLVGLFSSITGGVSYCLIKAGAKASDQPMITVFSFGLLATPAAGLCALALEDLVLPSLYSFCIMLILAVMAFFAELFLARGLQLEKTSKAANILYIEVALSLLWRMGSSMVTVSFGRLVGCLLIFVSACSTLYNGPDKEMDLE